MSALVSLAQQRVSAREHLLNIAKPGSQLGTYALFAFVWGSRLANASYWGFPVFIEDGESRMVWLGKLQFPSLGKYSVDFCNRAQTSSLLRNRQTNNPHAIYRNSLDPVFEFGSLISCKYVWKPISFFDHINLPLCTISLKSLSEKLHISVRRDAGEGFSLSEENDLRRWKFCTITWFKHNSC